MKFLSIRIKAHIVLKKKFLFSLLMLKGLCKSSEYLVCIWKGSIGMSSRCSCRCFLYTWVDNDVTDMKQVQPQSLQRVQCTLNSLSMSATRMSLVKINAAIRWSGTWKMNNTVKKKKKKQAPYRWEELGIRKWIMNEWWELDDGLCRPVSLWSLAYISLLIKKCLLSPPSTPRRRMVGGEIGLRDESAWARRKKMQGSTKR